LGSLPFEFAPEGGENLKTRCYIAGAGEFNGCYLPERDDYVIAADAGYSELISRGVAPDLVIGDFDSLGGAPQHPNVKCSPEEKDDTDVMLAVNEGFALGHRTFVINGGLGGKLDHALANIQIMVNIAKRGARGLLLGQDVFVTAISDGAAGFKPEASGYISVFSAGGREEGVTLTGLKYPLDNAVVTGDYPLGARNEFTGEAATVAVRAGTLVIIWEGKPEWLVL